MNIDKRPEVNPDLLHDISKPLPFKDNSVDEILAKDVLEHLSYGKVEQVLKDWFHVLKPACKIYIQTPDMTAIATKILNGRLSSWKQISYWIYGEQNVPENTHKSGFTIASMKELLTKTGFKIHTIKNDGGTNLMCWAYKP